MNTLTVAELTSEAFAPFGTIGQPLGDGGHGTGDVPLDLSQGKPRFYIMRLEGRAGLAFEQMARPDRGTQCLGTIDGGAGAVADRGGAGWRQRADGRRYPRVPRPGALLYLAGPRHLARWPLFHRGP